MSIRIMSAVWESGPADKSELLVLLALSDYANDEGECWPAVASIARKSRMSVRGVQQVFRRLESSGWLEIEAGNGRKNCNLYRIINPAPRAPRTECTPHASAETPHATAQNPAPGADKPSRTIKNHTPLTPLRGGRAFGISDSLKRKLGV